MAAELVHLNRTFLIAAGLIAFSLPNAIAQTATAAVATPSQQNQALQFDVATIKQNKSGNFATAFNPRDNGYDVKNATLKMIVSFAYGIRYDLISGGPDWITTDRFDVEGKVLDPAIDKSHPLTDSQRNLMVQSLLADRFKLAVHFETKQLPMYNLVIAHGGPHLQESKPDAKLTYGSNFGDLQGSAIPSSTLASILSQQLQHTVVDQTGLTGKYDIKLKWESDHARPGPGDAASDPSGLPSLFTALQEQLGLKLESTKGPVQTLVIDHIERPSEN
jgi:uncharacterized protein (TIGR03435 family)